MLWVNLRPPCTCYYSLPYQNLGHTALVTTDFGSPLVMDFGAGTRVHQNVGSDVPILSI